MADLVNYWGQIEFPPEAPHTTSAGATTLVMCAQFFRITVIMLLGPHDGQEEDDTASRFDHLIILISHNSSHSLMDI